MAGWIRGEKKVLKFIHFHVMENGSGYRNGQSIKIEVMLMVKVGIMHLIGIHNGLMKREHHFLSDLVDGSELE